MTTSVVAGSTMERAPVRVLRRKIVWVPLAAAAVAAGAIWLINQRLLATEAVMFEIGQSIRGRFDDFADDFKKGDADAMAAYYAPQFAGTDLGFARRQRVSDENGIVVETWQADPESRVDRAEMTASLVGFARALQPIDGAKFKMVFLNDYGPDRANVLLRFQVYGHDAAGHVTEDRGNFDLDLVRTAGEWQIVRQQLLDGKRVVGVDSKYFVDVTDAAGIDFNTGVNDIFAKQRYNFAIVDRAAGGVASGDYDNDGRPDLFFAGSVASKLYRNRGDGTFEDVTLKAGLGGEATAHAQGVVMADYNNDGCLDIFITKTPNVTNKLFRNNCNGTFTDVTKEAGLELASYSTTAAFADIDNDGYLDLYVGVYGNALEHSPDPPFHDRTAYPNHLYHNNGNGTFTDITNSAGVGDTGWTLGLTFWDYNNDGYPDIYVANDFGHKTLYRNDHNLHFTDVTKQTGLVDYGFGMSASPGDYDNDGNLDVYTSNIYSGTTWYIQHSIFDFYWVRLIDPSRTFRMLKIGYELWDVMGGMKASLAIGKKMGEGNALYHNEGNGTFKSVGVEKGVNMVGWAWASDFCDFDNDGDLDIHGVNGWISQTKGTDL